MARHNGRNAKSAERALALAQRRQQVASLRMAGVDIKGIAHQLQINEDVVRHDIRRLIQLSDLEAGADLRALQYKRLEALLVGIYLQASQGNLKAIDRALKIMDQENRLLGVEMPTKIAPTSPDGEQPYESLSPDAVMRLLDEEIDTILAGVALAADETQETA